MINLGDLKHLGKIAAENDNDLRGYFLETQVYEEIISGEYNLVLGRKGLGKSAICKYCSQSDQDGSELLEPDELIWHSDEDFQETVKALKNVHSASWRFVIAIDIVKALLKRPELSARSKRRIRWNCWKLQVDANAPRPRALKNGLLSNFVFKLKYFEGTLHRKQFPIPVFRYLKISEHLFNVVAEVCSKDNVNRLLLHLDGLDRPLRDEESRRPELIQGLVVAANYTHRFFKEHGLCITPVVYLRDDIWDTITFNDKTKQLDLSINLHWKSEELKRLVDRRLKVLLNNEYASWDGAVGERQPERLWTKIVARTFLRPRDIIQLINLCLKPNKKKPGSVASFTEAHFKECQEDYCNYVLSEIDDELRTHWSDYKKSLSTLRASFPDSFTREDVEEKLDSDCFDKSIKDAQEALYFFYRFSLIGFRNDKSDDWLFKYNSTFKELPDIATDLRLHPSICNS